MTKKGILLIISMLLLFVISACQSKPDEDVAAYVDGEPIPQAAFEQLAEQEKMQLQQTQGLDPETADGQQAVQDMRENLLDEMINQKLLYQHALAEGHSAEDAEVEAEFAQLKSSYSDEEFQEVLEASGLTEEMLLKNIRESMVTYDYLSAIDPSFEPRPVTEDELEDAYELYQDQVGDPLPMEDMIPDLEEYLIAVQEEEAYQTYYETLLENLREEADIEIFLESDE